MRRDRWVSRLKENLTSGSYGEGLETGRRRTLNGHEGGNPGYRQGRSCQALPRQSLTRQEQYKRAKCRVEIENFSGRSALSVRQDFYAKIFAMNLTAILVWVAQAIADRLYAARRHPYRVNFANALSKMKHAGARLLLGLAAQELVATLILAMAASVEAVRPDRSAPRKMKPAKIQGFYPNYKRCR